jgi:serine/threonine protein kinase
MYQGDTEIEILKLFKKEFIDKNITPNIIEIIYHKNCDNITKILPKNIQSGELHNNKIYSDINDHIKFVKKDLAVNKISFSVLEVADITFSNFFDRMDNSAINFAICKSIIFQIIYTLGAIKKKYPLFMHNDFHSDNIVLKFDHNYVYRANNQKYLVFNAENKRYFVPYFGIIPKIIDFGFSSLPEKRINSNILEDKEFVFRKVDNDILLLFIDIYENNLKHEIKMDNLDEMLNNIMPNRLYTTYEKFEEIDIKTIPSYKKMLQSSVFEEYLDFSVDEMNIYNEYFS